MPQPLPGRQLALLLQLALLTLLLFKMLQRQMLQGSRPSGKVLLACAGAVMKGDSSGASRVCCSDGIW